MLELEQEIARWVEKGFTSGHLSHEGKQVSWDLTINEID